jgi:hypothetical protein
MSYAPVNVFLQKPSMAIDDWDIQASQWTQLSRDRGGNPDFYPLTIKAFYVFGIMRGACQSVSILLRDPFSIPSTYYPAYAVFSSFVDLLGRCLRGNSENIGTTKDLRVGFQWLAAPALGQYESIPDEHILLKTRIAPYSISDLMMLRHFAAHGQSISKRELPPLDFFILEQVLPKIPPAMESYWALLQISEPLCNQLALANVAPYRNDPVWDTFLSFSAGSAGDAFRTNDWTYKNPINTIGRTA